MTARQGTARGHEGSYKVNRDNAVCRSPVLIQVWVYGLVLLGAPVAQPQNADIAISPHRPTILTVQPRHATFQSRWDQFEAEFGLPEQHASLLTASILRAKYGADLAAFSIKALSNALEDATEIRFSRGRLRRASSTDFDPSPRNAHAPGPFSLEDARLKFDFELATGKPYIGARLVFPFGN